MWEQMPAGADLGQYTKETRNKQKNKKHHARCQICKKTSNGLLNFRLCANCALGVPTKCDFCGQMSFDTERHMKHHHSNERLLECNVPGCTSRNVFTEEGLVRHRRRCHPLAARHERNERKRRQRSSVS